MSRKHNSDDSESVVLGWKFIAIVSVLTTIFFTFLYLAMSSKPDYMIQHKPNVPIQEKSATQ